MFVVLQLRNSEIHIIDYQSAAGCCRTVCGKVYDKSSHFNVFGIDNTFSGICDNCKKYYEKILINSNSRNIKSNVYNFETMLNFINHEYIGAKAKYSRQIKSWTKLNKLKRLVKREDYGTKYGK